MTDAIKIILGGQPYAVRPLSLGQLRRLMVVSHEGDATDFALAALTIALERAEPRPQKPEEIEATPAEAALAARAILAASGLVPAGEARAAASNGALYTGS